eukprot:6183404-Pleurochrysis_carterae.AAC.3
MREGLRCQLLSQFQLQTAHATAHTPTLPPRRQKRAHARARAAHARVRVSLLPAPLRGSTRRVGDEDAADAVSEASLARRPTLTQNARPRRTAPPENGVGTWDWGLKLEGRGRTRTKTCRDNRPQSRCAWGTKPMSSCQRVYGAKGEHVLRTNDGSNQKLNTTISSQRDSRFSLSYTHSLQRRS